MSEEQVLTRDEKVAKVLKLHDQLKSVKRMKKDMNDDYKDQIKGIEEELDALVTELKGE